MDKNIANACEGEAADHMNVPAVTGQKKEVKTSCYHCPHQADVQAGKYRDVAYAETPCGRCDFQKKSTAGVIEYREDWLSAADPAVAVPFAAEGVTTQESVVFNGIMLEVIHGLLSLSPAQLEVIQARLENVPYKDIAARQGVTTSMAELSHRRGMDKWKPLQALFAAKTSKQSRRRRPGSTPQRVEGTVRHGTGSGWRKSGNGYVRSTAAPDPNDFEYRQDQVAVVR